MERGLQIVWRVPSNSQCEIGVGQTRKVSGERSCHRLEAYATGEEGDTGWKPMPRGEEEVTGWKPMPRGLFGADELFGEFLVGAFKSTTG